MAIIPCSAATRRVVGVRPSKLFLSGKPKGPRSMAPIVGIIGRLGNGLPVFKVYLNRRVVSLTLNTGAFGVGFNRENNGRPIVGLRANGVRVASRGRSCTISYSSLNKARLGVARGGLLSGATRNIRDVRGGVFSIRCRPRDTPNPRSDRCLFSGFVSLVTGRTRWCTWARECAWNSYCQFQSCHCEANYQV